MVQKDAHIDAYIEKSADFAKPILIHFRQLVHKACPDVEEVIKWGFPNFYYRNSPMCGMAAFKKHCSIGFWKASIMKDAAKLVAKTKTEKSMGHLGKITSLKDLPSNSVLTGYIKDAIRLNKEGIHLPSKAKVAKKEIQVPDYFAKALSKNKKAKTVFDAFAPSHRREYLMWVTEAKTEETRNKRMADALEWIAEGKGRNWKYEKK